MNRGPSYMLAALPGVQALVAGGLIIAVTLDLLSEVAGLAVAVLSQCILHAFSVAQPHRTPEHAARYRAMALQSCAVTALLATTVVADLDLSPLLVWSALGVVVVCLFLGFLELRRGLKSDRAVDSQA